MEPILYNEQEITLVVSHLRTTLIPFIDKATILCLQGDLGAGKTTLTKALLEGYGVSTPVQSPTFVVAKWYNAQEVFDTIVHIDAYRIDSIEELIPIGFSELVQKPKTLVVIEWPENIAAAIPEYAQWFSIEHTKEGTRSIKEKND